MGREILSDSDTADYPGPGTRATLAPPPLTARVRVDLAGRTHPGKVRPNNEDNFHIVRFGRYLRTILSSLPEGQVPDEVDESGHAIAVADGMGGMAAGEVASRLAIGLLVRHALQTPDWILGCEEPYITEVLDRAARRFEFINEAVLDHAAGGPGLKGMGTTLSLAMSLGDTLIVAHVGDSPVLLSRRGALHRLTRDHTLARQLSELGATQAVRFHHVLTHAIGIPGTGGEPDIRRYQLADGDRLLLCTDGLTDMVDDETIARELARAPSAAEACRALIDAALDRGGKDNVTAVVADYHIPEVG